MHHFDIYGWFTAEVLPGRGTDDEPPSTSETTTPGELRANWLGNAWALWPYEPPPVHVPDLQPLREQARALVNAWRDEQEAAGIVFEHAGRSWDGGLVVRTRLAGLQSLQALPDGFFWTDAEDVDVPMTLAALAALHAAHEAAIVARGFEIHVRQRELKAAIEGMAFEQLQAFAPDWQQPDTQAPDEPAA